MCSTIFPHSALFLSHNGALFATNSYAVDMVTGEVRTGSGTFN